MSSAAAAAPLRKPDQMKKTYGAKKGEHVFYAVVAKQERRSKRGRKP